MKGVDVSKHNSLVDFAKLRQNGVEFVLIRAGYGATEDPKFAAHYKAAKAAGMLVGAYWFCYALDYDEAQSEADVCEKVLSGCKLDLPVFYDFEYNTEEYATRNGVSYTKTLRTEIISEFCARIESKGYKAGVYTNPDYLLYRLNRAWLKKYPLWIAAYRRNDCKADFETTSECDLPAAYGDAMVWQFGMTKNIAGHGIGYIDINYAYGIEKPREDESRKQYAVGDKYTLSESDRYTNGKAVPRVLWGKSYTIADVKADNILLKEILSRVKI